MLMKKSYQILILFVDDSLVSPLVRLDIDFDSMTTDEISFLR
jgi:hypothetical protein